MADYNFSLLDWTDGKGPQYKDVNSNTMKPHEGEKAPYQQLVDVNGVPFSTTNPMPVSAGGNSNADILIAQEGITVAAGAYESPAPSFTFAGSPYTAYIIGGHTPDAGHSWAVQAGPQFGGDYVRALYDEVTTTSKRILSDSRQLIIGESVVFRVSNQDTVSHTYNYYVLGLKGV